MSASDQIILEALEAAAEREVGDGFLDAGVFDGVPVSHVFVPEPGEPWDEDDVAAVRAVGEADVAAKIAYWRRVLDRVSR